MLLAMLEGAVNADAINWLCLRNWVKIRQRVGLDDGFVRVGQVRTRRVGIQAPTIFAHLSGALTTRCTPLGGALRATTGTERDDASDAAQDALGCGASNVIPQGRQIDSDDC